MARKRILRMSAIVVVAVLITAIATYWSTRALLAPPTDVAVSQPFATVEAVAGTVESSLGFNVSAEWATLSNVTNDAAGVVTEVNIPTGTTIEAGDVLYSVDLQQVTAIQGTIPAFRELSEGVSGADVTQLQRFLKDSDYYPSAIDGKFEQKTKAAVYRWQKAQGFDETGVVKQGALVVLPALPTKVSLNAETLVPGQRLSGGEKILVTLGSVPSFRLPLSEGQVGLTEAGMQVTIEAPAGGQWIGLLEKLTVNAAGESSYSLQGRNGAAVCEGDCDQVAVGAPALLKSKVQVVPLTTGTVVPSAALQITASGETIVVLSDGKRVKVTAQAAARGQTIVSGIRPGDVVRIASADNE